MELLIQNRDQSVMILAAANLQKQIELAQAMVTPMSASLTILDIAERIISPKKLIALAAVSHQTLIKKVNVWEMA
jgi:hypothetical protein